MDKFKVQQRLAILIIYMMASGKKECFMALEDHNGKTIETEKKQSTLVSIIKGKKVGLVSIDKKME
jgi:hypothetical protein